MNNSSPTSTSFWKNSEYSKHSAHQYFLPCSPSPTSISPSAHSDDIARPYSMISLSPSSVVRLVDFWVPMALVRLRRSSASSDSLLQPVVRSHETTNPSIPLHSLISVTQQIRQPITTNSQDFNTVILFDNYINSHYLKTNNADSNSSLMSDSRPQPISVSLRIPKAWNKDSV